MAKAGLNPVRAETIDNNKTESVLLKVIILYLGYACCGLKAPPARMHATRPMHRL